MSKKQKIHPLSDNSIDKLKKDFDFGNGVEFILTTRHPDSDTVTYDYFFTSKLPQLELDTNGIKRVIDVEASSTEPDDEKLLHYLHKNIR